MKWYNIDNWLKVTDVIVAFMFGYIGYSEWQKTNQLWAISFFGLGMLFLTRTVIGFRASKRKCPFCAELVQRDATVCKHCRKDITPSQSQNEVTSTKS